VRLARIVLLWRCGLQRLEAAKMIAEVDMVQFDEISEINGRAVRLKGIVFGSSMAV
jgi:hypothetical protein